jgi:hypothetical protein
MYFHSAGVVQVQVYTAYSLISKLPLIMSEVTQIPGIKGWKTKVSHRDQQGNTVEAAEAWIRLQYHRWQNTQHLARNIMRYYNDVYL